jgi:hypothetical protein
MGNVNLRIYRFRRPLAMEVLAAGDIFDAKSRDENMKLVTQAGPKKLKGGEEDSRKDI